MQLNETLSKHQSSFHEVMKGLHNTSNLKKVDMSKYNEALMVVDVNDTAAFTAWMELQLEGKVGWGGYMEHREIYRRSKHFDGQGEPRSLHLGIDLWAPAGTALYCPLHGVVESFADNAGFANYGPTIIVKHLLDGHTFFTLYGHLSRSSLVGLSIGDQIQRGSAFATLGDNEENGNWPPHLHFQLITDLMGKVGDFPGVAAVSDRAHFEKICPDPNLVLNCQ